MHYYRLFLKHIRLNITVFLPLKINAWEEDGSLFSWICLLRGIDPAAIDAHEIGSRETFSPRFFFKEWQVNEFYGDLLSIQHPTQDASHHQNNDMLSRKSQPKLLFTTENREVLNNTVNVKMPLSLSWGVYTSEMYCILRNEITLTTSAGAFVQFIFMAGAGASESVSQYLAQLGANTLILLELMDSRPLLRLQSAPGTVDSGKNDRISTVDLSIYRLLMCHVSWRLGRLSPHPKPQTA